MADPVHLPYTLRTWLGMVHNGGRAHIHGLPSISDPNSHLKGPLDQDCFPEIETFDDYLEHDWNSAPTSKIADAAATYILQLENSNQCELRKALKHEWQLLENLRACHARVTREDLKRFMVSRARMDLERAAGVVVSAMVTGGHLESAAKLVKELTGVLTTTFMWIPEGQDLPSSDTGALALRHLCEKIPKWLKKADVEAETPQSLHDLVTILLRVRRCAPKERGLHIPFWMFKEARMEIPEDLKVFFDQQDPWQISRVFPSRSSPSDTIIVLPRKTFRALQRKIFALFRFWRADCRLKRDIQKLENEILFPTDWIDPVLESGSIAQLCLGFFRCQRRLQKKVVSDIGWSRFLSKGEGRTLYQNNLKTQSTFEQVLAAMAVDQTQATEMNDEPLENPEVILSLIDQTCALMKEYVNIFGEGKKENLVFKPGQRGGSGRGPVDKYNLLCDILSELKSKARGVGTTELPGPVHKFLAKDIMAWNNGWADDAFANGKIPGWETWLRDRELARINY